jgi:hypothetical protein
MMNDTEVLSTIFQKPELRFTPTTPNPTTPYTIIFCGKTHNLAFDVVKHYIKNLSRGLHSFSIVQWQTDRELFYDATFLHDILRENALSANFNADEKREFRYTKFTGGPSRKNVSKFDESVSKSLPRYALARKNGSVYEPRSILFITVYLDSELDTIDLRGGTPMLSVIILPPNDLPANGIKQAYSQFEEMISMKQVIGTVQDFRLPEIFLNEGVFECLNDEHSNLMVFMSADETNQAIQLLAFANRIRGSAGCPKIGGSRRKKKGTLKLKK